MSARSTLTPEQTYLIKLSPCLQWSANLPRIRSLLQEAKKAGLDPKDLYQTSLELRPKEWPAMPTFEEVMKTAP